MSEPIHPIRKLHCALLGEAQHKPMARWQVEQRIIARHVKPLLEELERGVRRHYPRGTARRYAEGLIAAWRAKP